MDTKIIKKALYMETRNFTQKNLDKFNSHISSENWDEMYKSTNTNAKFNLFMTILKGYFNTIFSQTLTKIKSKKQKSWLTKGIKISCERKRSMHEIILHNKCSPHFIAYYKTYKSTLKKVIKQAKLLIHDKHIAKAQNKTKAMWNIVKNTLKNRKQQH